VFEARAKNGAAAVDPSAGPPVPSFSCSNTASMSLWAQITTRLPYTGRKHGNRQRERGVLMAHGSWLMAPWLKDCPGISQNVCPVLEMRHLNLYLWRAIVSSALMPCLCQTHV